MGGGGGGGGGELWKIRCQRVLEHVMQLDLAQIYFNDPVDVEALGIPEYNEIIEKPMDLGTTKAKLLRDDYKVAEDLLKDITLVWSNCR